MLVCKEYGESCKHRLWGTRAADHGWARWAEEEEGRPLKHDALPCRGRTRPQRSGRQGSG